MSNVTVWRWEQDGAGGDHGTLTLWPGTADEVSLTVADFRTARLLADAVERRTTAAYVAGKDALRRAIERLP